jgi:hypothetical protein
MSEKSKFIITVTGQRYDGTSGCERLELEDTAENRKAIQAYQANRTRSDLRRLIGPTADEFKDGWTFKDD